LPDAPLWPGTRPGGHSHGTEPKPNTTHHRSGSVDYGAPFEPGTFYRRRFQPALLAVGLPSGKGGVRLHDLRHTFGSLAASRGIDPARIASWMGHASDVITRQVYLHLYDADTARAAEILAADGRPTATKRVTVTALRRRG
jgi:integrase